jgi:hypothetical protein
MVIKSGYACIVVAGYGPTGVCKSKYTVMQRLCSFGHCEVGTMPNVAIVVLSDRKLVGLADACARLTRFLYTL